MRIKILIVEDLLFLSDLMVPVLTPLYDVTVASNLAEARAAMAREQFQIALLDLNLGDNTCGLDLAPELFKSGTKMIVISAHCSPMLALACLRNHVSCFIDKHTMGYVLLEKIELVLSGKKDFPEQWLATAGAERMPKLPTLNLTKRKILSALVRDHNLTNAGIGDIWGLNDNTIKKAMSDMMRDFRAQSRFDLIMCAKERGFVPIALPLQAATID